MTNVKLTPNIVEKLKYINNCLDHIENEIEELNIDLSKPENKLYEKMQKDLGPIILAYLIREM